MRNEELEHIEKQKDRRRLGDIGFEYEKEGYMKRQPRSDISKQNYNYEQFREFTKFHREAKQKD